MSDATPKIKPEAEPPRSRLRIVIRPRNNSAPTKRSKNSLAPVPGRDLLKLWGYPA